MGLVFDTGILIEIERKNEKLMSILKELSLDFPQNPSITAITYSEFYYGYLSKSNKNKELAQQELEKYEILNTTKNSSKIFAELKFNVEQKGRLIPLLDLLIASIVIDNGMTLVTSDNHFNEVEKLEKIVLQA